MAGVNILRCVIKTTILTDILLISFAGINTMAYIFQHLAESYKLIADNLIIFIKSRPFIGLDWYYIILRGPTAQKLTQMPTPPQQNSL